MFLLLDISGKFRKVVLNQQSCNPVSHSECENVTYRTRLDCANIVSRDGLVLITPISLRTRCKARDSLNRADLAQPRANLARLTLA